MENDEERKSPLPSKEIATRASNEQPSERLWKLIRDLADAIEREELSRKKRQRA